MSEQSQAAPADMLQKLLSEGLSKEEEKVALETCVKSKPGAALSLLLILLDQKHRYRAKAVESDKANAELYKTLQEPPWHPAAFIRFLGGGDRALVAAGGRRFSVVLGPGIEAQSLRCGRNVMLNANQNVLINVGDDVPQPGAVAEFSRFHGAHRAVLRGHADEEVVVDLAADLIETGLASGDVLLYDRDNCLALERVENRHRTTGLLEELPLDVRIEQLGGLDDVFGELVTEVTLHLFHPELVERYKLKPTKGALFCGPPGTGKTSLLQALGEYLKRTTGADVKVFVVRPGIHRSMWFGVSEQRIRELFREAKEAAEADNSYVLVFFDDMDHLGSRDHRLSGEVDARLLPCFLQEIDNIRTGRLLLFGATNREDLLDEALLRPGRFGKIFRFSRPNRRQAREILARYVTDLPVYQNGQTHDEAIRALIEGALAAIYSPNGELATIGTLTFRDGSRRPLMSSQLLSGAFIADAVEQAKRRGCFRAMDGNPGEITAEDLLSAIDRELASIAERLKPGPALQQMLNLPQDLDVVRVELSRNQKTPRKFEYLKE